MNACDVTELAAPGVRSLRPYEPGKPEATLKRELGLSHIVKLASNENPLGPSPRAMHAVSGAVAGLARYPDGNGFELKHQIARLHQVDPATITLGNGSNDILELVARTFLTPEHEAVFSQHAFAVYPLATQAVGATSRVAAANPADHPMPFGHDLGAMADAVGERTRVVFVANPNNPTGTWLPAADLRAFLRAMPGHVIVVVDEAYVEYAVADDYQSAMAWVSEFPNLLVSRTFSKAYGLAGLRVGYSVSHPLVADLLNRVRQPFNVNSLALVGAAAALDDGEFIARSREVNLAGLRQLHEGLGALGLPVLPSAANFLCVNMGQPGRPLFESLLRQGVIVRPVDNYGLPDYLRVTVGTESENARFLDALATVLRGAAA